MTGHWCAQCGRHAEARDLAGCSGCDDSLCVACIEELGLVRCGKCGPAPHPYPEAVPELVEALEGGPWGPQGTCTGLVGLMERSAEYILNVSRGAYGPDAVPTLVASLREHARAITAALAKVKRAPGQGEEEAHG